MNSSSKNSNRLQFDCFVVVTAAAAETKYNI